MVCHSVSGFDYCTYRSHTDHKCVYLPTITDHIGVCEPQLAKKVETRTVYNDELPVTDQDWDAWSSDNENNAVAEITKANGISQAEKNVTPPKTPTNQPELINEAPPNDEDVDEAWGWNDDDDDVDSEAAKPAQLKEMYSLQEAPSPADTRNKSTREMTMTERYWTSSLPQPIVATIRQIYEDGAKLLQPE